MQHATTVFVDDYIAGRTPGICVITGEPTADRLTVRTEVDGPSAAWFVLILFPLIGWLILAVVLASARRSYLTGTLALSAAAYQHLRRTRRTALGVAAGGLGLLLLAGTGLVDVVDSVAVVVAMAMMIGGVVTYWVIESRSPRVRLDASRRWVSIQQVHPNFVAAVGEGAPATVELR